jgi:hypothetical protein
MHSKIKLLFTLMVITGNVSIFSEKNRPSLQIQDLTFPVSLDSVKGSPSPWLLTSGNLSEKTIQEINAETFSGYTWKEVKVPGNVIREAPEFFGKKTVLLARWIELPEKDSGNLSLRLGVINDRDRVFFNGVKIGETGDWDAKDPQAYDKIRIYPLPNQIVQYGRANLLLIQVKPYFDYITGVEQDSMWIGHSHQILKKYYLDEYTKLLFLMIYLTVGAYFLFLFIRRQRESENLIFALFSFGLVGYNLLRNQIKYEFGIPFIVMKRVEYSILLMLIPLMFHFIRKLFGFDYLKFFKILDAFQLCVIFFFLFSRNIEQYNFITSSFVQPTWILYVIIILYYLFVRMRQNHRRAYLVLIGMVIILAAALLDIISARGIIVFPRLLGYAFLAFNISLATILANSFVKLNEEVEDLNKNLELKVVERTNALNRSLNEVQTLKEQQDGDYFLTSLLINPLAKNNNRSSFITTEFFTKQKKTFEFRGKENEIGGDICISDQISLGLKNYIVFINGDAMGKSIQGAGGALVLGVVFHAVIARTKANQSEWITADSWLKDLFLELQTTFESFDGSMLTSIALGLIDEDTGELSYINAEHPWTILYRDKKASFLEDEMWLRKLGFPRNDKNFAIKKFQLYPGDVLICGSDGRDDIALHIPEIDDGMHRINEDSMLIVKWIEETKANLVETVYRMQAFGDLTDDLTLIKISYKIENN